MYAKTFDHYSYLLSFSSTNNRLSEKGYGYCTLEWGWCSGEHDGIYEYGDDEQGGYPGALVSVGGPGEPVLPHRDVRRSRSRHGGFWGRSETRPELKSFR